MNSPPSWIARVSHPGRKYATLISWLATDNTRSCRRSRSVNRQFGVTRSASNENPATRAGPMRDVARLVQVATAQCGDARKTEAEQRERSRFGHLRRQLSGEEHLLEGCRV